MDGDRNPYQPPASLVQAPEELATDAEEAGKGRRFATLLVDYVGFILCAFIVGLGLGVVLGDAWVKFVEQVPDFVFGAVFLSGYYVLFEGTWARTPGKWVCGTRVVDEGGDKPQFGRIMQRTLCRLIPFEPFSFLAGRGWHDKLSKTRVIRTRGD